MATPVLFVIVNHFAHGHTMFGNEAQLMVAGHIRRDHPRQFHRHVASPHCCVLGDHRSGRL